MAKKSKFRMDDHIGNSRRMEQVEPVLSEKAPVPPTHVPIKLLYDTWDKNGDRILAGTFMEMPLEVAKRLIETGKVERADPLPGE